MQRIVDLNVTVDGCVCRDRCMRVSKKERMDG